MLPKLRPFWAIVVGFAPFVFVACSSESVPEHLPCPNTVEPSFRVKLTSEDGALPQDTQIEVTYGAGHEVYALGDATRAGKSVFCEPLLEGDASVVEAIACELWTSGAATLRVSAIGYEPIDETLSAERDECGIRVTEVLRTLEREKVDGG